MSEYISRKEHEEMLRRMDVEHQRIDDENQRQNKRITIVEESVKEYGKLIISIHELATEVKEMRKELKKQGAKLEELEQIPAKNWNTVKTALITGIITTAIGLVVGALGF